MAPTTTPFNDLMVSVINVYTSKLHDNLKSKANELFLKDLTLWLESKGFKLTRR